MAKVESEKEWKEPQLMEFKLKHKFSVSLWDANYLGHLENIGKNEDSKFVFGRPKENEKNSPVTVFYIAGVMKSLTYYTNNPDTEIAKNANELIKLFYAESEQIYDEMYLAAKKIKQRLSEESEKLEAKEESIPQVFDNAERPSYNFIAPEKVMSKNGMLLIRILKLLDNAVCDLEILSKIQVLSTKDFHKQKRALVHSLKIFFLNVSGKGKRFHSMRKKRMQLAEEKLIR